MINNELQLYKPDLFNSEVLYIGVFSKAKVVIFLLS